jgi:hypothetical protein
MRQTFFRDARLAPDSGFQDDAEKGLFEGTARLITALEARPDGLVFAHGDIHYLTAEAPDGAQAHLRTLLQEHIRYYDVRQGTRKGRYGKAPT